LRGTEVRKTIAENYENLIKEEGVRHGVESKKMSLKINADVQKLIRGPPPLRERLDDRDPVAEASAKKSS